MAIDRAAAKAAGYSDAEIDAYEAEQKKKQPEPQMDVTGDTPPPPPPADVKQGEASGASLAEVGTTLATAAAPYALPAVGIGAGAYGAFKVGGWGTNLAKSASEISKAMSERTAVEAAREARMANRPGFGGTPAAGATPATAPVTPATAPAPATPGPVAPQAAPAQSPAPAQQAGRSIVQTGMDYANRVRQAAMDKVITPAAQAAPRIASAAAPVARAATGIGALVMPGNTGQNYPFPMSGPMKGREINPQTGAPWTPQELQAYRAQYGS